MIPSFFKKMLNPPPNPTGRLHEESKRLKGPDSSVLSIFLLLLLPLLSGGGALQAAKTRYTVPTGGVATGEGTGTAPWTLAHALKAALPGDVIYARDKGTNGKLAVYSGRVAVQTSGTVDNRITLKAYPGETPILDGTGSTLSGSDQFLGLLHISTRSNWIFEGLTIRNLTTTNTNTAVGILLIGTCQNISIQGCTVHGIKTALKGVNPGNASGIAVYGTSGTAPCSNIAIDGCVVHTLLAGASESVVFNGNVDGFSFTNNVVRDSNNIGVDVIGFERTAPANDQARNGVIRGNIVRNIDSRKNPPYHGVGSAAGIYVDGGRDVLIEHNWVEACNFGIDVASEARGRVASNVTVQNNWVSYCHSHGIQVGGGESINGGATGVMVRNNTLYKNIYSGVNILFNVAECTVRNNIVWAGSKSYFVTQWATGGRAISIDYNLYFSDALATGKGSSNWAWANKGRTGLAAWKAATGFDKNSKAANPKLTRPVAAAGQLPDLRLQSDSPAINAGDPSTSFPASAVDMGGSPRISAQRVDVGADEFAPMPVQLGLQGTSVAAEFGTTPTRVIVRRFGDLTAPLPVTVSLGGSATNGVDYVKVATTVTIPAGASEAPILITPKRDTLCEGTESIIVGLAVATNGAYEPTHPSFLMLLLQDTPVDSWRKAKFGTDATVAARAGNNADPDADGLTNITEYALGGNPLYADGHLLPQPIVADGRLTMVVHRSSQAPDVFICPEVATRPTGPWVYGPNYVTTQEVSPHVFLAMDKTPLRQYSQRFMRLRICLY